LEPLDSSDVDVGHLIAALEAEAAFERALLPPEPWWSSLLDDKQSFAESIHRKLLRGAHWPLSAVVDARKPGHGTRPVAVMSPDVRVLYRAIASALVPEAERPDRSMEGYAEFVLMPIRAAFDLDTGLRPLDDAKYSHILVTDVTAFFQYIDHELLREELDLAAKDIILVDALIGLLGDMQGRSFGIPQRSSPSDWIADAYAARIERWAVREGFDVWRYSDDFRIGCLSYPEALRAIETLSRATRDCGLTLNEQKTATPSFRTYFRRTADAALDDVAAEVDLSDVEAIVSSEYPSGDDDQALDDAKNTIDLVLDPEGGDGSAAEDAWDLRELAPEQHAAIRRALRTLTRNGDSSAMSKLDPLLKYQPALTHSIVAYVEAIARDGEHVKPFFDAAVTKVSLNEWQRAWVAYGLRACAIPLNRRSVSTQWLLSQLTTRPDSLPAAEAAVTLSTAGLVSFRTLENLLHSVNADFTPWYLYAIANLRLLGAASAQQVAAIRQGSSIAKSILREVS